MVRILTLFTCVSIVVSAGCRRAVPLPKGPPVPGDPIEVIQALEALRVKLDFDNYDRITRASFVGTDITDEDLKLLIGLKHIDQLNLIGTDISDRGLRYLGQVKGVRYMFLNKTNITQEGVWLLEKDIPETTLITAFWDRNEADPKEPPKVAEYPEDLKDKTKPVHVHPVTVASADKPRKEKPKEDTKPKDGNEKPGGTSKPPAKDKNKASAKPALSRRIPEHPNPQAANSHYRDLPQDRAKCENFAF